MIAVFSDSSLYDGNPIPHILAGSHQVELVGSESLTDDIFCRIHHVFNDFNNLLEYVLTS